MQVMMDYLVFPGPPLTILARFVVILPLHDRITSFNTPKPIF